VENTFDRDYGLPPVESPEAIVIAPIVLNELPLATDLPFTREY
jgi:hypothetical protein